MGGMSLTLRNGAQTKKPKVSEWHVYAPQFVHIGAHMVVWHAQETKVPVYLLDHFQELVPVTHTCPPRAMITSKYSVNGKIANGTGSSSVLEIVIIL